MRLSACIKLFVILIFTLFLAYNTLAATAPVTLFAPGLPMPEKKAQGAKKDNADHREGIDIIISLIQPYEFTGREMDRPQILGMYEVPSSQSEKAQEKNFIDLLSDLEEIRYLDSKAWNINIAPENPGLYQLVLETKPWWDERRNIYIQHQGKLLLPILGVDDGWNMPTGQSLEIVPLTNPFGLTAPAFFSGRFLVDGKPVPDMEIIMGKLNSAHDDVPTRWHEAMEARSDANGQFGFVLNKPGWWFCEARIPGNPLKSPDGETSELLRSTLLWVHVADPSEIKTRKKQNRK